MADLVDREYLFEAVEQMEKIGTTDNENDSVVSTNAVLDIIDNAPTVNKMILCSEKLPEIGVPVLTYDGRFYSVERRIEYIDTDDGPLYGDWWIDGYNGDESYPHGLRDAAPTHWMPLPKAPDVNTKCSSQLDKLV